MHLSTVHSDGDWHSTFVEDLEPIKSNVEKVTPALRDVEEEALSTEPLVRLLDTRLAVLLHHGFFLLHSCELGWGWHADALRLYDSRRHRPLIEQRRRLCLLLQLELDFFHLCC